MKAIGIIVALDTEYAQLHHILHSPREERHGAFTFLIGTVADKQIILTRCGIGKVNAACGATTLINTYHPSAVISTGVAGGIDTALRVMDVVVSRQVVYHDVWCGEGDYGQVQGMPPLFTGDPHLLAVAQSVAQSPERGEGQFHFGLICTGDKFITDHTQLAAIKTAFPQGLAVDMESGAIAHTCHLHAIPFISFRIISDTPGVESHWSQYENFWDTIAQNSFANIHAFIRAL